MRERVNPFPYNKPAADNFKMILTNIRKISSIQSMIIENSWNLFWQMEKLRSMINFSFCHNDFKSCLLQRCRKASVCGKGLSITHENLNHEGITGPPWFSCAWSNMTEKLLKQCLRHKCAITLSFIRQSCSRQLWTYFVKKWKISIIEWISYD